LGAFHTVAGGMNNAENSNLPRNWFLSASGNRSTPRVQHPWNLFGRHPTELNSNNKQKYSKFKWVENSWKYLKNFK
jgi:hypothetical protein